MTLYRFEQIEEKIINIIGQLIVDLRNDYFEEYVLLIARADYNKNIGDIQCDTTPYDFYNLQQFARDETREKFMIEYINRFKYRLTNQTTLSDACIEYDINIQLMIYSHVWESQMMLKTLRRIASIINNNGYEWRILFTKENGAFLPRNQFIENSILKPLKEQRQDLYKLLCTAYNSKLRNDFSHSDYLIKVKDRNIISYETEGCAYKQQLSFEEWNEIFVKSILLSYYLQKIIDERLQNYTKDESPKPVNVKIPYRNNPDEKLLCSIEPYYDESIGLYRFRYYQNK